MSLIQTPGGWHHQGLFMGMHLLWWLFWILTAAVVLWAFWRVVRDRRSRQREEDRREEAEEVLRRRFGEGEIDEDEFLHRMHLLRESRAGEAGGASGE